MVQGTMSGAGKSLLVTALCRIFRQDGLRAAPFKSQNMALNSCVTPEGLEMGRAQAVQAQAAGLSPDVRMNPVLLKPTGDTGSQVIVNGRPRGMMSAAEYFRRKKELLPDILAAYHSLARENDVIVIEGAGSPVELNLREGDIVNMGLAALVDAPVLLVGDIDRGGVFAQLYGTVSLLTPDERRRVAGTVVNKFRGDPALFAPGVTMLEELTGVPVLGVVPFSRADIDEEDSLSDRLSGAAAPGPVDVAVLRPEHISNFTDFTPLARHPALGLRYVTDPAALGSPDFLLLPGTRNTLGDLRKWRQSGLADAAAALIRAGTPALGICGGYQMLGEELSDPTGTDGGGTTRGLGFLPCRTVITPDKTLVKSELQVTAPPLAGARLRGYEIHMGRTRRLAGQPFARRPDGSGEGAARGLVFGTYLHGLFDSGELTDALARWLLARKGLPLSLPPSGTHFRYQEEQIDLLAADVRAALDMDAVYRIAFRGRRACGPPSGGIQGETRT